jgi:hypothetical protein
MQQRLRANPRGSQMLGGCTRPFRMDLLGRPLTGAWFPADNVGRFHPPD